MRKILKRGVLFAALVLSGATAWGQWATQTITLQPGWNAIYLEIQPVPQDCDTVFSNLGVESVWGWNRRFSPVQYIQNSSQLVPTNSDWLYYFPLTNKFSGEISLFNLQAGNCYLVKRPNNAQPTTWVIQGQPSLRQMQWVPNSFNLAGFPLDRTNPPTFQAFFSGSPAHASNPVFRLNSDGTWGQVSSPASMQMRSGEAFWIQCTGVSTYQGPVSVAAAQRTGLTYGRGLVEQTITIQNSSPVSRTIVITPLTSGLPVGTNYPALAGAVPLSYWKLDQANNVAGWFPLNGTLVRSNLASGQALQLRLEVRRPDMTPYNGTGNSLYQSLLEVRDAAGSSRAVIPVSAQGLGLSGGQASSLIRPKGLTPAPLHPGLWIGNTSLSMVNQPASANPAMPTNTASPFQFRLIIHVDSSGQARLMQRILQMWQPGTYKPDPNNPANQIVDQPGQFVLVTDENLIPTIPGLTGAALRDGQPVGRRFSTAAFGFRSPVQMSGTGDFGTPSSLFTCQLVLDYDDPLNPFKHKYHPDHDNLDAHFLQKLPEGVESFTVTRQVQLQFTATAPDNLALAGWGDTQLGGIYTETITGLHQQPLYIQGTFRLQQASRTIGLNGKP
jgi:hypothetical protein